MSRYVHVRSTGENTEAWKGQMDFIWELSAGACIEHSQERAAAAGKIDGAWHWLLENLTSAFGIGRVCRNHLGLL